MAKITATVTVRRDGPLYRHLVARDNGVQMINAPIHPKRARQIIEANPEGEVTEGELDFNGRSASWVWQTQVEFEPY